MSNNEVWNGKRMDEDGDGMDDMTLDHAHSRNKNKATTSWVMSVSLFAPLQFGRKLSPIVLPRCST
jgi:hypothetical protein